MKTAVRAALVTAGVFFGLIVAELALRATGFQYQVYPHVQFGWPTPVEIQERYQPDPDVLWVTKDFANTLADAQRTHPAVVFLGDSCTEWGTYPSKTLVRLQSVAPQLATGAKFGAGGWSSEQGLALLRRDLLRLAPKVLTIYFGWNDHWIALGPTDGDLTLARRLQWLDRFRVVQLVIKARMGVSGSLRDRPNRVPLERYEANLKAMIFEAQAKGVSVVVITAPSYHVPGREPEYLTLRHVRSLHEVIPLHRSYVEATRRVARGNGATLCDAAEAFAQLPGSPSVYFRGDGIHLTDAGDRELARLLTGCIVRAAGSPPDTPSHSGSHPPGTGDSRE